MRRDGSRSSWLLILACAACDGSPEEAVTPSAPSASPSSHPVDHLAQGELAQGEEKLFGLPIPRKMRVERRFLDAAHAAGPVTPEDLSNYVRQRVSVAQVEIGAARTVFPRVVIHGGDPHKIYRIEVSPRSNGGSELEVRDITPAPVPSGLSDAELWRRAGRNPDGTPIDPKKLE